MKWKGRRGSRNIEDRRGRRGGGRGGMQLGGLGILAIVAIGYFTGVDVSPLLEDSLAPQSTGGTITDADRQAGEFVSVTLADTEEVWAGIFRKQLGDQYTPVTLVLYKGITQSPCGGASGATGPFYCPGDRKVYLDTGFFTTMSQKLGAGGDFAAAYVVAHEVAHHVQNELGILGRANQLRQQVSQSESNGISVRIELQADCFSGLWAREVEQQFGTLEQGDIGEAVNAARQIGDDTLQQNAGRTPMPHTFTHGTSEQRMRWFSTGYKTGDIRKCDTFSANRI
ncbi:neutral zinc metallopeptidase [Aliiroseovarius sp. KMU-50]|uniref:Neutral zinc metallopeptidase n=1 Tax=Aliiroseovarius salicola TaxID=3009082 RepID=A0ABT4W5A2_9RHOB|nr:neutral zinc metallopeptidase [Aliiroseovarius sp. KMU-50]MDA5094923.1 neutral zinc metallopeptidase [Aliiroseovarius sp. KMU-50]